MVQMYKQFNLVMNVISSSVMPPTPHPHPPRYPSSVRQQIPHINVIIRCYQN